MSAQSHDSVRGGEFETTVTNLQSRVQTLETYFKVALAVAAIFGISGAFVMTQINSLSAKIKTLSDNATKLSDDVKQYRKEANEAVGRVEAAQARALASLPPAASEAVDTASAGLRTELAKALGVQSGSGRLGWDFVPNWPLDKGAGERIFRHHVTFDTAFRTAPKVRAAISGLFWDGNGACGVEVTDVQPRGFDLLLKAYESSHIRSVQFIWVAHN